MLGLIPGCLVYLSSPMNSDGCGSKPMGSHFGVGKFTTHFSPFFSGDWDVHWGYDLDFDPWPDGFKETSADCQGEKRNFHGSRVGGPNRSPRASPRIFFFSECSECAQLRPAGPARPSLAFGGPRCLQLCKQERQHRLRQGPLRCKAQLGVALKMKQEGQNAGLGPCFHLGQPILEFRSFEPPAGRVSTKKKLRSRRWGARHSGLQVAQHGGLELAYAEKWMGFHWFRWAL